MDHPQSRVAAGQLPPLYPSEEGSVHSSAPRFIGYDWREYAQRLENDNRRLHQTLDTIADTWDRERRDAARFRVQNTQLMRRTSDLLSRLSTNNQTYSQLRAEHRRQAQRLEQSTKSERVAWCAYNQVRELFSGKAKKGETVLDTENIDSLKMCIVNLVVKGQHREVEVRALQNQLNIQRQRSTDQHS